ncbi:MAG: metallophosphoesterase [Verrucomicrobiales bacterium]|nr:metallophosphoesterase [Verrucomicrobiales bacterium]
MPAPKNTPLNLVANGSFIRTFYFRKHFTLPFGFTSIAAIRHVIDDGIIVYGNGSEIHRLNMPTGAVTYATLANVAVGDAEFHGPYVAIVPLITGDNVIAAEVHQATPSSGDVCFGAELSLTAPSPSPIVVTDCFGSLCFSVQTNQLVLRWDAPNGILQNAFSLQGTNTAWRNVMNATSPYIVARSNTAAFFRLKVD